MYFKNSLGIKSDPIEKEKSSIMERNKVYSKCCRCGRKKESKIEMTSICHECETITEHEIKTYIKPERVEEIEKLKESTAKKLATK